MNKYDLLLVDSPNIDMIVSPYENLPEPGQDIRVDKITLSIGGAAAITSVNAAKIGLKTAVTGFFLPTFFWLYYKNV